MKSRIGTDFATNKKRIEEEYGKYLSEFAEWTLFFNVSFQRTSSYGWAKKRFKWFFKYLNTENEIFFSNYVRCWVFYERHNTSRGSVHIHALIDRVRPEQAEVIQKKARSYFGEWSKVEPYDPTRGAAYYVAKKINNPKLLEYEFYVINSKLRRGNLN